MCSRHVGSLHRLRCHPLSVVNCGRVITSSKHGSESMNFAKDDDQMICLANYLCKAISAVVFFMVDFEFINEKLTLLVSFASLI